MRDKAVDDAVAACQIGEAGHGTGTAAHFAEGAFDHVGGVNRLAPKAIKHGPAVCQTITTVYPACTSVERIQPRQSLEMGIGCPLSALLLELGHPIADPSRIIPSWSLTII